MRWGVPAEKMKSMTKERRYCSTTSKYKVSLQGAIASGWRLLRIRLLAILVILLMCSPGSFAYSVLTHEEIVDLLWKDEIRPLLLERFPALTEDQITEAHAYAYGGAVIQDLGDRK